MIRKCTDEDISDEELEKVIDPFYDNYYEFVTTYIMPETIAFYIASSYSRNAMWEVIFFSIIITFIWQGEENIFIILKNIIILYLIYA